MTLDPRDEVVQMFVSQIYTRSEETFQPWQACIMGLVVDNNNCAIGDVEESLTELAERGYKRHVYKIDDGTGTLTVVHAAKRSPETDVERAAVLEQAGAGSSGLVRLASMAENGFRAKVTGFDIGDCVCVTGRFRTNNKTGEVVLMANHVQKVDDPNIEIDRILRMDKGK